MQKIALKLEKLLPICLSGAVHVKASWELPLTQQERKKNSEISQNNLFLNSLRINESATSADLDSNVLQLEEWFQAMGGNSAFMRTGWRRLATLFFETRFCRYLSRVLTLDFGTLRNDSNKKVIHEVGKRMKYSLTLAIIPLLATFALCTIFGMVMAVKQNRWMDYSLNIVFLILFAIPVFVVAPFLIEKFALNKTLPFTKIPIPYSGFHSPNEVYENLTSAQRMGDILLHIFLPLIAIKYGTLAVQARLAHLWRGKVADELDPHGSSALMRRKSTPTRSRSLICRPR